jgi:sulfite exporter TauE/SafE
VESGTIFWPLLLTALTTGLMGSLHCLGMCGGISATVALASPLAAIADTAALRPAPVSLAAIPVTVRVPASSWRSTAPSTAEGNVVAFNAGRIASYALAGALSGALGGAIGGAGPGWVISESMPMRTLLFLFANLMIIFTGLYLMGVPQLLAPLEKAGGHLWRHVAPWSRRLLPLRTRSHAALFGMLWGWIPCGMVYAMLLSAMSAGNAAGGAMTMVAFGLGTLPVMVGSGWSAGWLRGWTRKPWVRLAAGMAVVTLGLFGIARMGSLEQLRVFGAFCAQFIAPAGAPLAAP